MEKNFKCVRHLDFSGFDKSDFKGCSHFLFDNKDNIVCVFPQGKYQYQFFNDLFYSVSGFIDTTIMMKCLQNKAEYYKFYRRYFMSNYDRHVNIAEQFELNTSKLHGEDISKVS